MSFAAIILFLVTLQRFGELWIARRNTATMLAKGAKEVAPEHYPLIVAVHAAWLIGLWWFAALPGLAPNLAWLGVFVVLQLGRIWVLATLGERWTTRIIVLPKAPLIVAGPFRYLSHPNYVIVAGEIAVLPICFGLYAFAMLFTALNAFVLAIRIHAESAALRDATQDLVDAGAN